MKLNEMGDKQTNSKKSNVLLFAGGVAGIAVLALAAYLFFSNSNGVSPRAGQEVSGVDKKGTGTTQPVADSPEEPFRLKDGILPALPATIEGSMPLKIVSARLSSSTESLVYPFSGTMRVWNFRIVLQNTGKIPLVLGDRFVLYESGSDGTSFEGMTQWRGGAQGMLPKHYGVSNDQENDEDNELFQRIHNFDGRVTTTFRDTEKAVNPCFGVLLPGTRAVLQLTFSMQTILKDKYLSSVKVFSPVVYAPDVKKGPAALLVAEFKRPEGDIGKKADWISTGQSQISLDFERISKMAGDNTAPAAMRLVALNWLAEIYRNRSLPMLIDRLSASNEAQGEIRAAAAHTLGDLQALAAAANLTGLVKDKDEPPGIRGAATGALGKIGDQGSLEVLQTVARDANEYLAGTAIGAIGAIGGPQSIKILSELLRDQKFAKANEAPAALAKCGADTIEILSQSAKDKRQEVAVASVQALGSLLTAQSSASISTNDSVQHQLPFNSKNEQELKQAAERLRNAQPTIPSERAQVIFTVLAQALKDERFEVQGAAIDALSEAPGHDASQQLLKFAQQTSAAPSKLVQAIATRYEPEAGPIISALLADKTQTETCKAAIESVVKLNIDNTGDKLIELAKNGNDEIRQAAVDALGKMHRTEARGLLESIVKKESEAEELRTAALTALAELDVLPSEPILLTVALNTQTRLRWACLEHLCTSDSEASRNAVTKALQETDETNKYERENLQKQYDMALAHGNAPDLKIRLASSNPEVRAEAAAEILKKNDRSVLAELKNAVKTETQPEPLSKMVRTLKGLKCNDRDLVQIFMQKLDAQEKEVVIASATMLRYLTGTYNGPFAGETEVEIVEDINYWKKINEL